MKIKIYDIIIIVVALLELVKLSHAGYSIYIAPVILFLTSWIFIFGNPIYFLINPTSIFDANFFYIICPVAALVSIPILIRLSREVPLLKRLIYIFIIPSLIMGIAFIMRPPFH